MNVGPPQCVISIPTDLLRSPVQEIWHYPHTPLHSEQSAVTFWIDLALYKNENTIGKRKRVLDNWKSEKNVCHFYLLKTILINNNWNWYRELKLIYQYKKPNDRQIATALGFLCNITLNSLGRSLWFRG